VVASAASAATNVTAASAMKAAAGRSAASDMTSTGGAPAAVKAAYWRSAASNVAGANWTAASTVDASDWSHPGSDSSHSVRADSAATAMEARATRSAMEAFTSMESHVAARRHYTSTVKAAVLGMARAAIGAVIEVIVVVRFVMPCVTTVASVSNVVPTVVTIVPSVAKVVPAIATVVAPAGKVLAIAVVPVAKVTKVSIEIMLAVAEEENRREAHVIRRIEAPTEWAVKDSVPWNERISAIIRIPIPTASISTHLVVLRLIEVGFRQIRRAQAAPAIQIVLDLILIELLCLHGRAGIEDDLMSTFYRKVLAVHFDLGFTLVDANEIVVGVKVVEAGLDKANLRAVFCDDKIVFRVQLGDLDGGFAFVQAEFRVGQSGRNHCYRAVVAESEKGSRRQEKLCFACQRLQRLTRPQFCLANRFRTEALPFNRSLALDVVQTSRTCRIRFYIFWAS